MLSIRQLTSRNSVDVRVWYHVSAMKHRHSYLLAQFDASYRAVEITLGGGGGTHQKQQHDHGGWPRSSVSGNMYFSVGTEAFFSIQDFSTSHISAPL